MPFPAKAQWIWCCENPPHNSYACFRTSFPTPESNGPIQLHISADTQFCIHLNGSFLPLSQYPAYPAYCVSHSLTLSGASLRPTGEQNLLEIGVYYQGKSTSCYRSAPASLLFEAAQEGRILCASGPDTLCCIDPRYHSGEMEMISSQLSYTFAYDSTLPLPAFSPAVLVDKPLELHPCPVRPLTFAPRKPARLCAQGVYHRASGCTAVGQEIQNAYLSSRTLRQLTGRAELFLPSAEGISFTAEGEDGVYAVIDLGEETSGILELELSCPAPADIHIGFGEHLNDLRVRTYVGGRNFACTYRTKAGRQTFTHYFRRLGARYLQLHVPSSFRLYYAGLLPTTYPVSELPSFACDDPLHQKIYDTCRDTLLQCMHEHYEDCPWREQSMYNMDSRTQMLCGYYAFGEYEFPRAALRLVALSQREDGLFELCSPAEVPITIPCFSLVFAIQVYEYLLYSGDRAFVRTLLPVLERMIAAFEDRRIPDGLLCRFSEAQYWNFYDWTEGMDGGQIQRDHALESAPDGMLSAFYSLALDRLSKICAILEEPSLATRYAERQSAVNEALRDQLWADGQQAFRSFADQPEHFCEYMQALAILCGAASEEQAEACAGWLRSHKLIAASLNSRIFVYEALLAQSGKNLPFVFQDIAKIWGDMLFQGATTFWETELGASAFDLAGSLCHGWSAVPLYIYWAYVLGVKPLPDGTGRFVGAPGELRLLAADAVLKAPEEILRYSIARNAGNPPTGYRVSALDR